MDWTTDPRYLRGYQGFERNKLIEERFFSYSEREIKEPPVKSVFGIGGKRGGQE